MPPAARSTTTRRLLLGGGAAVLVGGFLVFFFGGGWYVLLLIAMGLSAHDNDAPAGQLTTVQGTVRNAETHQPIAGMLLSVRSYSSYEPSSARRATDSASTDAQGRYYLRFRNKAGLYYQVRVDYPPTESSNTSFTPARYWFANHDDSAYVRDLTLGRANTFNFRPGERLTVAVRVHNRRTGYQFLQVPDYEDMPLSNRDTTLYLTYYELPAEPIKFHYVRHDKEGNIVGDTAVAVVLQNPAARYPDTMQATLTLVR